MFSFIRTYKSFSGAAVLTFPLATLSGQLPNSLPAWGGIVILALLVLLTA